MTTPSHCAGRTLSPVILFTESVLLSHLLLLRGLLGARPLLRVAR